MVLCTMHPLNGLSRTLHDQVGMMLVTLCKEELIGVCEEVIVELIAAATEYNTMKDC